MLPFHSNVRPYNQHPSFIANLPLLPPPSLSHPTISAHFSVLARDSIPVHSRLFLSFKPHLSKFTYRPPCCPSFYCHTVLKHIPYILSTAHIPCLLPPPSTSHTYDGPSTSTSSVLCAPTVPSQPQLRLHRLVQCLSVVLDEKSFGDFGLPVLSLASHVHIHISVTWLLFVECCLSWAIYTYTYIHTVYTVISAVTMSSVFARIFL